VKLLCKQVVTNVGAKMQYKRVDGGRTYRRKAGISECGMYRLCTSTIFRQIGGWWISWPKMSCLAAIWRAGRLHLTVVNARKPLDVNLLAQDVRLRMPSAHHLSRASYRLSTSDPFDHCTSIAGCSDSLLWWDEKGLVPAASPCPSTNGPAKRETPQRRQNGGRDVPQRAQYHCIL